MIDYNWFLFGAKMSLSSKSRLLASEIYLNDECFLDWIPNYNCDVTKRANPIIRPYLNNTKLVSGFKISLHFPCLWVNKSIVHLYNELFIYCWFFLWCSMRHCNTALSHFWQCAVFPETLRVWGHLCRHVRKTSQQVSCQHSVSDFVFAARHAYCNHWCRWIYPPFQSQDF